MVNFPFAARSDNICSHRFLIIDDAMKVRDREMVILSCYATTVRIRQSSNEVLRERADALLKELVIHYGG